jgi:hypothetical protein
VGLPEVVRAEMAKAIRTVLVEKSKTDPSYEGIKPGLLEGVIDADLIGQAYNRASRGLKRRPSTAHDDVSKFKARMLSKRPGGIKRQEQHLQPNSNRIGYTSPGQLSGDLDAPPLQPHPLPSSETAPDLQSTLQELSSFDDFPGLDSTFSWTYDPSASLQFDPGLIGSTEPNNVGQATNGINGEWIFRPPDACPPPPASVELDTGPGPPSPVVEPVAGKAPSPS